MSNSKEILLYDDPKSARFIENISGWVDINNRFFGNNPDSEHMARWSSCTHKKCECGKLMTKGWIKCDECRLKAEIERYNKLPFKEYNGEIVFSCLADKYFIDSDEIDDYCSDEEIDPAELMLVYCEPNKFWGIRNDFWDDIMPEDSDGELPIKLQEAVDSFNKLIEELPPASYSPGKVRTQYIPNAI